MDLMWQMRHTADLVQCKMCLIQATCRGCSHQVQMPLQTRHDWVYIEIQLLVLVMRSSWWMGHLLTSAASCRTWVKVRRRVHIQTMNWRWWNKNVVCIISCHLFHFHTLLNSEKVAQISDIITDNRQCQLVHIRWGPKLWKQDYSNAILMIFTRDSIYAIARICHANSVCLSIRLSVCPSVTRVYCIKTA